MKTYRIGLVCHEEAFDEKEIEKKMIPVLKALFSTFESIEFYVGYGHALDTLYMTLCCSEWNSKKRSNLLGFQTLPEYIEPPKEIVSTFYLGFCPPSPPPKEEPAIHRDRYMAENADLLIGYAPHEGETLSALIYAASQGKSVINLA